MTKTSKDGFSILGLGAAACVACFAGPILAFLGGLSLAGIASTWFIGVSGLIVAAIAAAGFAVLRRRRQQAACATSSTEPTPVALTSRPPAVTRSR